jgi:hypothetical protein
VSKKIWHYFSRNLKWPCVTVWSYLMWHYHLCCHVLPCSFTMKWSSLHLVTCRCMYLTHMKSDSRNVFWVQYVILSTFMVVFLKPVLPHFCNLAKSRPTVEKLHCSNLEMYSPCRLCWIMVSVTTYSSFWGSYNWIFKKS